MNKKIVFKYSRVTWSTGGIQCYTNIITDTDSNLNIFITISETYAKNDFCHFFAGSQLHL